VPELRCTAREGGVALAGFTPRREYHTLVRLKHPRIIEVYDYGVNADGPYYTMELLSGRDLQELAPLSATEVCSHLRDVASSLALLHAQGLLHRDVSPRNVRLTADGRTKLIDFGALTPFGIASVVVGSPICMAPELLRRMPLDQRVFVDSSAPPSAAPSHQNILLTIRQDGRAVVVGGIILEASQPGLLDLVFLDGIARLVYQHEAVSSAF
jgi:serine/threonine protein kinase